MGGGDAAHAAFEQRAAVNADARRVGDGGSSQGRPQAAGLRDLQRVDIGRAFRGEIEGIGGIVHRFVGHDRHVESRGKPAQRAPVATRHGLFDQRDPSRFECCDAAHRGGFVPSLVDVDRQHHVVAKTPANRLHVGEVFGQRVAANLEFEDFVAPCFDHRACLVDIARGVSAGKGPQYRQGVAHRAAQQRVDRQAQALPLRVKQRDLNRRLGERVALHRCANAPHRDVDASGILMGKQRRKVGVDRALDAFGALVTIGQAANRGGFADAGDAVAAGQAHDHQRLAHHGGHRELVGTNGGQVDQNGFDGADGGVGVHGLNLDSREPFRPISIGSGKIPSRYRGHGFLLTRRIQ